MNVWIVPIEAHQQRYTCELVTELPRRLRRAAKRKGMLPRVRNIKGALLRQGTTPGAFLNFAATNIYKGTQIARVAELFSGERVQPGDVFLVADAWHPGVLQIRYMSALLNVPVHIIGLWHAGHYDPNDFLGRLAGQNALWAEATERALLETYDLNVFATQYHLDMFCSSLGVPKNGRRVVRCGWPMEYLPGRLKPFRSVPKHNLVLFPHRIAPEKQVRIFDDLAGEIPDWQFDACQRQSLTKREYHQRLAEARVVFSCSLQETLGIGCYEGVLAGAVPMVPDRLSYREMYPEGFRYPSEWTSSWDAYLHHKPLLVDYLRKVLARAEAGVDLEPCRLQLTPFFSGKALYDTVFGKS